MKYLRWLLFPFAVLYGLVTVIRNWLYSIGLFKSRRFNIPLISVGNLDAGGSGKTPMTEYIIRLLKPHYKIATLSRGYGRKTRGFLMATPQSDAKTVGDEPAQLKHKFPDIDVAVCEDRVTGINKLVEGHDVIIMDDAYQHRAVKPGLSILLFDYHQLQDVNLLLPAGNRRELFNGRKRAEIMVVTKCPADMGSDTSAQLKKMLAPYPHQKVFFSTVAYQPICRVTDNTNDTLMDDDTTVFLLTGIARPQPLVNYIRQYTSRIIHHKYPDHHLFSLKNITKLAQEFSACQDQKKIIVTTEKDVQRLEEQELQRLVTALPVYTLPINVMFLNNGHAQFNKLLENYVREYTTHHRIH